MSDSEPFGASRSRSAEYIAARGIAENKKESENGILPRFAEHHQLYKASLNSALAADPSFGQQQQTLSSAASGAAANVAAWASRLIGAATSATPSPMKSDLLGPSQPDLKELSPNETSCCSCHKAFGRFSPANKCPCCKCLYCSKCYGSVQTRFVLDYGKEATIKNNATAGRNNNGAPQAPNSVFVNLCAFCSTATEHTQEAGVFSERVKRSDSDNLALLCCDITMYMDAIERRLGRLDDLLVNVKCKTSPDLDAAQRTVIECKDWIHRVQSSLLVVQKMAAESSPTRQRILNNFRAYVLQYLQTQASSKLVVAQQKIVKASSTNPEAVEEVEPPAKKPDDQQPTATSAASAASPAAPSVTPAASDKVASSHGSGSHGSSHSGSTSMSLLGRMLGTSSSQTPMGKPDVASITPAISLLEGSELCISGYNFHDKCKVTILDKKCKILSRSVLENSMQEIHIMTPSLKTPQIVSVVLTNPNGDSAKFENLIYVSADMISPLKPEEKQRREARNSVMQTRRQKVTLDKIVPSEVSLKGGDVELFGSGFVEGMKVFMDSTELSEVVLVLPDANEAILTIPPVKMAGVHDITARNPDGSSATLKGALYCVAVSTTTTTTTTTTSSQQSVPPRVAQPTSPIPVHQSRLSSTQQQLYAQQQQQQAGPAVVVDKFEMSNPHSRKWG